MKIRIIAEASTRDEYLLKGWGLSVLINDDLLFDTFSNAKILKRNIKKYNIDISRIKYVVISHEHWDHTGGLWWLLQENNNVTVFVLKRFSDNIKKRINKYGCRLIEIVEYRKIKENIFTSGEICGIYNNDVIYEQSLIIIENKTTIITGCSHPGLQNIIKYVKSIFPNKIKLIIGGFHLHESSKIEINVLINNYTFYSEVEKIAPCHCTGKKALKIFKKTIPDKFLKVNTGTILHTNNIG